MRLGNLVHLIEDGVATRVRGGRTLGRERIEAGALWRVLAVRDGRADLDEVMTREVRNANPRPRGLLGVPVEWLRERGKR